MSVKTVNIPKQYARADVVPGSLDREARTFDVVWTTGARVLRGWFDRFWEELSLDPAHVVMGRMEAGAPLLADHLALSRNTYGITEDARLEAGRGLSRVRFLSAGKDPEADKLFERVAEKIVRGISVGYVIHKLVKTEETRDGFPVYRAEKWEPLELSLTPIPADAGAHVRSGAGAETYPCEIITRGGEPQKERGSMTPEELAAEEAKRKAELEAEAQRRAEAAVKVERERVTSLRQIGRQAGAEEKEVDGWIADGKTPDQARALALDMVATRSERAGGPGPGPSGAVEVGETDRQKFMRGAESWLITRAGAMERVQDAVKRGKVRPVDMDPAEFRGLSLINMARECLERVGVSTRRMSDERIADLALSKRGPGLQTASDFPVLLENVTYKLLLSAYETQPYEWSRFCRRGSVANFHPHNRYRPGAFGTLDPVNDHGELKNKAIPDGEKRQVMIGTYGNTIGVSRRTLIQDDMGVFTDLAPAFGMAAGNTVETTVWGVVKANTGLGSNYDADPLFHASRNNINTVGSALSVAGLDADRVIMKRQSAPSGVTVLNLVPAILVLPTELGMLARTLNNDAYDPDGLNPKFQKSNGVRGMFRDIVDSAQLTGTRRYLFADPAIAPVIEVTFLEGQEAPQMSSQEGFEVLGLQWRIFFDFGVNLVDYRGAVTNAGA